jgi:hypothetical protein
MENVAISLAIVLIPLPIYTLITTLLLYYIHYIYIDYKRYTIDYSYYISIYDS